MSFSEERFEEGILTRTLQGGPSFSTTVVSVNSGYEQRNRNWQVARGMWQLGNRLMKETDFQTILKFFYARAGKFEGFRIKDWTDFRDSGNGILGTSGVVTDYTLQTWQLHKKYTSGSSTYVRKISKPVIGRLKVFVNAVEFPIGASEGQMQVNWTTGVISFNPYVRNVSAATNAANCQITTSTAHGLTTGQYVRLESLGGLTQLNNAWYQVTVVDATKFTIGVDTRTAYITGITQALEAVVTTSNVHGYQVGEQVRFSNVLGMTQINTLVGTITAASSNSFTVNIDSTAFTAYSSGGTARKTTQAQNYGLYTSGGLARRYLQNGDLITWEGEFDVPVRFDIDSLDGAVEEIIPQQNDPYGPTQTWVRTGNIPLVELRL